MKKIILIIACLFYYGHLCSQNLYDVNSIKAPSYNELSKFTEFPLTYSLGLPNISYPIMNLPSKMDDLNLNFSIDYHPNNISYYNSATDLGLGWNLVGAGSITKNINYIPDEFYDYTTNPQNQLAYPYNTFTVFSSFDDVYYYNFFGYSGKFKFLLDDQNNTISIIDLSQNNFKFEFIKTDPNHLKIDKFIITDTKGYKYFFEIKDKELFTIKLYNFLGSPNITPVESPNGTQCYSILGFFENGEMIVCDDNPDFQNIINNYAYAFNYIQLNVDYTSNFLISKVTDKNNAILYNFNYEELPKNIPQNSDNYWYVNSNRIINKLDNITSQGVGSISFDFSHNHALRETLNDITKLNSLILRDTRDNIINKVEFVSSNPSPTQINIINPLYNQERNFNNLNSNINSSFKISERRFLNEIHFKNSNSATEKKLKFHYNTQTNLSNNGIYKLDYFGFLDVRPTVCEVNELDYEGMTNKNTCTSDVLTRIDLPTGNSVNFEFESNTFSMKSCTRILELDSINRKNYFDHHFTFNDSNNDFNLNHMNSLIPNLVCSQNQNAIDAYYNYNSENKSYDLFAQIPFIVYQGNNSIALPFTITESGYYTFEMEGLADECTLTNYDSTVNPYLKIDEIVTQSNNSGNVGNVTYLRPRVFCPEKYKVHLTAGSYFINVSSNCGGRGSVIVNKEVLKPLQEVEKAIYGGGLRVKRSYITDTNSNQISHEKKFYYNDFDDVKSSSGEIFSKSNFIGYYHNSNPALYVDKIDAKIVYRNVMVENVGLGYEKYYFHTINDGGTIYNSLSNGVLDKYEIYNNDNVLVKSIKKYYEFGLKNNYDLIDNYHDYHNLTGNLYNYGLNSRGTNIKNDYVSKEYTLTKNFLQNGSIEEKNIQINNDQNFQLSKNISFNSQNEKNIESYFYPHDLVNPSHDNQLLSENLINQLVLKQNHKNSQFLSEIRYEFDTFNNFILPEKIHSKKTDSDSFVLSNVTKYNEFKKPLEVIVNNTTFSFIYGYHNTQPVAKLENIAYDAIPSSLITAIQSATDAPNATESSIITALDALRTSTDTNMQKAMITTYTYKPLVGITSVTDPKGDKQTYQYDSFNRLEFVKDKNGNILSENKYHYRTQN